MMLYLSLPLTLALYALTRAAQQRLGWTILNPVLWPTVLIMGLLASTGGSLADYQAGAKALTFWLEPAVVALAIPLYRQRHQIYAKWPLILACSIGSVLLSVGIAVGLGTLLGADQPLITSLSTRSITTPLAMSVSKGLGGVEAIAAALVVMVGITGALIGPPLLRLCGITHPEAQGLAMGAAAHAVGTAAAAQAGPVQGAFASLAMVICGLLTACLMPLLFALMAL